MRAKRYLAVLAAAALLLTACGKMDSSSSGSSSSGASGSGSGQKDEAWKTGLAIQTETKAGDKAGEIHSIAAAVLLDEDGRIVQVVVDELEGKITTQDDGAVTVAEDLRTKRQKTDEEYPMSAVSSIGKSWIEQADAFGEYLMGKTAEEVRKVETDSDGYAKDADLLSGCTIKVDGYREAVAAACAQAKAMGAAEGDSLALGVKSNHVLGDDYGMREASALGKEWYEQSDGYASYLKGKTAEEIEKIPSDGSDADLASMCTINTAKMQKAVLRALDTLRG